MHFGDTIFIFLLALVVFGPKKLPEIGRQIGKLMVEFRRASNDFKLQIEEELRSAEQAERQKALAAEAAKRAAETEAAGASSTEPSILPPSEGTPVSQSAALEAPAAEVPVAAVADEDAATRAIAEIADRPAEAAIDLPATAGIEEQSVANEAAGINAPVAPEAESVSPNAERYYQGQIAPSQSVQNENGVAGLNRGTASMADKTSTTGTEASGTVEAAGQEAADDRASIHHV
jgi:sec-independent protein translocase protein TatB